MTIMPTQGTDIHYALFSVFKHYKINSHIGAIGLYDIL